MSEAKKTTSFRYTDDEQKMIDEIKDRLQKLYPEIKHPLLGTKEMNYSTTDTIIFALNYTYQNWMGKEGNLRNTIEGSL